MLVSGFTEEVLTYVDNIVFVTQNSPEFTKYTHGVEYKFRCTFVFKKILNVTCFEKSNAEQILLFSFMCPLFKISL